MSELTAGLELNIPDDIFEKLKEAADEQGCTVEEYIEEIIRNELDPELEEV